MSDKKPVIVITGPTASGKTALSLQIAKTFDTEIISADSVQNYRGLNIGSAKPTLEERQGIVHHLMDFLPPDAEYSVAQFVRDAKACADTLYAQGKIPVMVGGTGLYITSFLRDLPFVPHNVDENLREQLRCDSEQYGNEYLMEKLKEVDPESAAQLHENDTKRIIRALEFFYTTRQTKSQHDRETRQQASPYEAFVFMIDYPREMLYSRINQRVDIMFSEGLLDEVMALKRQGYTDRNCLSMQGIGYKETLDYIRGLTTLRETKEIIKRYSRNYAKRQLTWFRRDDSIVHIPYSAENACQIVRECVEKRIYKP